MRGKLYIILIGVFVLASCEAPQKEQKAVKSEEKEIEQVETPKPEIEQSPYVESSVDDALAQDLNTFLINDYLKRDLQIMSGSDKKYQFQKVDLNGDGENEIFIQFISSYFCGSGGCTFLLLSSDLQEITTFTVTNPPIFVEELKSNGWNILLVKDQGVYKELKYENGSYPSNPSIVEKAAYDAPSGHARVLFDKNQKPAKTYTF